MASIDQLAADGGTHIVTLDLAALEPRLASKVHREIVGSILDTALLDRIHTEFEIDLVFHLAALLSTRSEFSPGTAHEVNVGGTLNLLELAQREAESHGRPSSSCTRRRLPLTACRDLETKHAAGRVGEDQWTYPTTMYGCNKLYCEHLGRYYAEHYQQLSAEPRSGRVDFRAVRFPGLISAATVPSGGTSDYAPEMLHAAARAEPYACFVRPDTRIPFMAMPDAVAALLALARAPKASLTRTTYNLGAFAPSADEIRAEVLGAFPGAQISFAVDRKRQGIVDSWPEDVDDGAARRDWGFAPSFDFSRAFGEYLVPAIRTRYGAPRTPAGSA